MENLNRDQTLYLINKSINDHCRDALEFCGFERDDRYVETIRKIYKKKYYKHIVSQYNY